MNYENKPDIVQMFDRYVDREYYKITSSFWGTFHTKVRADRLKNSTELMIECKELPDCVMVNGKEYTLVEANAPQAEK